MSDTTPQEPRAQKKLKIFWNTNAEWSTSGYGQQIAEILPRIQSEGFSQAICPFFGLEGGILNLNGIPHFPRMNHVYGSDAMVHHAKRWGADVTISLQDIWVLSPEDLQNIPRWIPVVPIDHEPVPKVVLDRLRFAYRIVTYSQFGQKELERNGIHSTYIPHTVDTSIFKQMDKKEQKKAVGLPDDVFLCGMVAANKDNPPRKSFQEVMDAFKMFLKKVPDAYLYLHTNPDFPGGFPLKDYANFIGITDRVLYPDVYQMTFETDKVQMAKIYNTFDMLLAPSISEGFGVPIIEAQACGVPVVTNNFTAMPELVINHVTGEVCDLVKGPNGHRYSSIQSYVGIPDTTSIYNCMMRIKDSDRTRMGDAARKWIVENYDSEKVFKKKWIPFLEKLEKEIYT